jgi:hypothetical protein
MTCFIGNPSPCGLGVRHVSLALGRDSCSPKPGPLSTKRPSAVVPAGDANICRTSTIYSSKKLRSGYHCHHWNQNRLVWLPDVGQPQTKIETQRPSCSQLVQKAVTGRRERVLRVRNFQKKIDTFPPGGPVSRRAVTVARLS